MIRGARNRARTARRARLTVCGACLLAAIAGAAERAIGAAASGVAAATGAATSPPVAGGSEPRPAPALAEDLVASVDVEQKLGDALPLAARFRDEQGRDVELGSVFGERPVVIALVYYECPMLCTLVLNGLVRAMQPLALDAGRDFDVLVVSFDPQETPALARAKKATYVEAYGRDGAEAGWHFWTGERASIEALTGALGFRYAYDAARDEYAHAASLFVATPEGRISRYLFGVEYSSRDLRLALVESVEGGIGTLADALLLLCYHYDPSTGRYTRAAMGVMRAAGAVTVVAIGSLVWALRRREHARSGAREAAP
jgi:protein SCO1/2